MSTHNGRFELEGVTGELRKMLFELAAKFQCSKAEVFRRGVREMYLKHIGEGREVKA